MLATANRIIDGFPRLPAASNWPSLPVPAAAKGLVEMGYYLTDEEEAHALRVR